MTTAAQILQQAQRRASAAANYPADTRVISLQELETLLLQELHPLEAPARAASHHHQQP